MIKCPRCKQKIDLHASKCFKCGLKTTQILAASNTEAVKVLKTRRKAETEHIKYIKQIVKPLDEQIKETKKLYKFAENEKEKNALAYKLNELQVEKHNTIAKINRENYDAVYFTNLIPSDISRKKLILYVSLLGCFGAHAFYVGRVWRGIIITALWCIFLIGFFYFQYFTFNNQFLVYLFGDIYTMSGATTVILVVNDLIRILLNKFKIPVKIPPEK